MSLFEIKNISYRYDKYDKNAVNAISDISFNVEIGDFLALIGKSGSGKSTIITHLNGLLKADKGDILFKGKSIYDKGFDITKLRFSCGLVFQYPEYQLFAETVIEDVAFGAIKKGLTKEEAYARSEKILEKLGIAYLKTQSPFTLSGGEKRKVALAGVLVMEPEVLILDEPEAGLDSSFRKELFEYLSYLNKTKNVTIIFISHDYFDVIEYANRVAVVSEGKLLSIDSPYNIFSNANLMNNALLDIPDSIKLIKLLESKGKKIDTTKIKFDELVDQFYYLYK